MSDTVSIEWEAKRRENATLIPLAVIRTPMGDYFFAPVHSGYDLISLGIDYDADVSFDAEEYFDGGAPILERRGRLLSLRGLEERAVSDEADFLASFAQSERPSLSLELENDDGKMSEVAGREYLLGRTCEVYWLFPGLLAAQSPRKFSGKIARWELSKRALRIEAEANP